MNAITGDVILAVFLIFCRLGGCLMVAPGLSSPRVPVPVRLFLAIALSLSLSPMLVDRVLPGIAGAGPARIVENVFFETMTGLLIGFLGRLFYFALQTVGIIMAQSIGLGALPGIPYEGDDAAPTLSSLLTMAATTMLFVADLHWELLRGIVESYRSLPPGQPLSARFALTAFSDQLTTVFLLALRISSPFVIYSVMVNIAMGLINKLTPAIPVYFIMTPVVLVGGFVLMLLVVQEFLMNFMAAFGAWLATG